MEKRDALAKDILYTLVYRRKLRRDQKAAEIRKQAVSLADKIMDWEGSLYATTK